MKDFTLARLKAIAAFLGALITFATTLDFGVDLPVWVTSVAALLTFVAVYAVPNIGPEAPASDPDPEPENALRDPHTGEILYS